MHVRLGVGLLLISAAVHFFNVTQPREVIFDEVHFGKFVTSYCCTGQRFFDIHPPHAKLLIAAAAKIGGYDGTFSFDHIGQPYDAVSPIVFRIVPALAGTLLPVVLYFLLRQLGASAVAAWFGGLLAVFDNALLVQTRIMALDGVLLLATFGSLSAYLAVEQALLRKHLLSEALVWGVVAGLLAGVAVGVKFTGLIALGLIGIIGLYRLFTNRRELAAWLQLAGVILVSAAVIYIGGWVLHFALLSEPGSGDAWGVPQFESPVIVSFGRELIKLHKTMYNANNGLTIFHHDSSPWWGWPFMNTPVFYWQKAGESVGGVGAIYFIGNPVVWVGSTILLLAAVGWWGLALLRRGSGGALGSRLIIPLLGYMLAFWPLTRVDRGLFLYHYLTPLLFALLIGVLWLDGLGWFSSASLAQQPRRVYVSLALVILFFLMFSPLTFGWLLHPDTQALLFWSGSWR